jgi:biopolymer transport protein ExbB/TolQ
MVVTAPEKDEKAKQPSSSQVTESGSSSILVDSPQETTMQPVSVNFSIQDRNAGTSVSSLISGILGFFLTVLFFGLILVLPENKISAYFLDRGEIPYALVFVFFWSFVIIYIKYRNLATQKDALLYDLLPTEISNRITLKSVGQFIDHIEVLPPKTKKSYLVNRILRGLEHFRVLHRNSEVATRLTSQSEIDAISVDSSYTLLRVFIWALPILGFIGTVLGIGNAISELSTSLSGTSEIEQLKGSLLAVSDGLSIAFDTTLLSLVMSLLVMFPTSTLQNSEDELLNTVDEYCNEIFLKRLFDGDRSQSSSDIFSDKRAIQESINRAMANHHSELQTWNKKLEAIADSLSKRISDNWRVVDKEIRSEHHQNISRLEKIVINMQQQQGKTAEAINNLSQSLNGQQVNQAIDKRRIQLEQEMANIIESFGNTMRKMSEQTGSVQTELSSLNQSLEKLQDKQIIIEDNTGEQKKKRGLFK